MTTEVSFLLTVIALLPRVLATSAVTFLCLWVGKHYFIFLQGFYMVSKRHILLMERGGKWLGGNVFGNRGLAL